MTKSPLKMLLGVPGARLPGSQVERCCCKPASTLDEIPRRVAIRGRWIQEGVRTHIAGRTRAYRGRHL